jgi:hypothetical protein
VFLVEEKTAPCHQQIFSSSLKEQQQWKILFVVVLPVGPSRKQLAIFSYLKINSVQKNNK